MVLESIDIEKIIPDKNQPRKNFDENSIKELSDSIKSVGLISPIIVKKKNNQYIIIAGERRYRASKLIGIKKMDCLIYEDENAAEISIIENLQRKDLSPVEEAVALKTLAEEKKYSHENISKIIGKSRSYVTNKIRLLNLDKHSLTLLEEGKISEGHARTLLKKDEDQRKEIAKQILKGGLSVRDVERITKKDKNTDNTSNLTEKYIYPTEILEEALSTKVYITADENLGKITIEFYGDDQLNDILEKILGDKDEPGV